MAGKGAAVAEGLGTRLAVVRLLASVNSLMHSQGRPLDELLSTVGPVTHMRSNTAVDALVASEITSSREALSAGTARISLHGLLGSLGRLMMLRNVCLHGHGGHAAHIRHLGVARELHAGHGIGHVHGCLHGNW